MLTYAAHTIDLSGEHGPRLERELLEGLEDAESNDPAEGNGRSVYENHVRGRDRAAHPRARS